MQQVNNYEPIPIELLVRVSSCMHIYGIGAYGILCVIRDNDYEYTN